MTKRKEHVLPTGENYLRAVEAEVPVEDLYPYLEAGKARIAAENLRKRIMTTGGVEKFVCLGREASGRFIKRG